MSISLCHPEFDPASVTLAELRSAVWRELATASGNMAHPWRLPNLATVFQNEPRQRIVVLRSFDFDHNRIFAHTDVRSPKVEQIRRSPSVSWLFYDPHQRIQLTLSGTATLHIADEMADRQWEQSRLSNRIAFLAERAPGTPSETPSVNLPEGYRNRIPTAEESAIGRANFAVIEGDVELIDLLFIRSSGNLRASFHRTDGDWTSTWVDP